MGNAQNTNHQIVLEDYTFTITATFKRENGLNYNKITANWWCFSWIFPWQYFCLQPCSGLLDMFISHGILKARIHAWNQVGWLTMGMQPAWKAESRPLSRMVIYKVTKNYFWGNVINLALCTELSCCFYHTTHSFSHWYCHLFWKQVSISMTKRIAMGWIRMSSKIIGDSTGLAKSPHHHNKCYLYSLPWAGLNTNISGQRLSSWSEHGHNWLIPAMKTPVLIKPRGLFQNKDGILPVQKILLWTWYQWLNAKEM